MIRYMMPGSEDSIVSGIIYRFVRYVYTAGRKVTNFRPLFLFPFLPEVLILLFLPFWAAG